MKVIISLIIAMAFGFNYILYSREFVTVDHVDAIFNGKSCEVYFFKRWGTYSHPVTPIDPIEFEEALMREGFCRAWMCKSQNDNQFIFFEAKTNKIVKTELPKPIKNHNNLYFYESIGTGDKLSIGHELSENEMIKLDSFLVSLPGSGDYLSLVSQKMMYSYQYVYDDTGALKQVILTGEDGDISTLDY